jgi:Spy/CpxP family protein refolding chaperone
MRGLALGFLLLAAMAGPLAAQGERDTHPRAMELRDRIERQFAERVKEELGLTDEQAAKLKAIATQHGGHRREFRRREQDLRAALDAQIGGTATSDQDSVARLTKELLDLRVEYAESWRMEMGELSSFLTPVQRARLLVLRERLLQRVHEMRNERRGFRGRGDVR